MTLNPEDYAVLAQIRDGKSLFSTGGLPNSADSSAPPDDDMVNHVMRDRLQRFYMAGFVTSCFESAVGYTTVGQLTPEGLQALTSR